jgi:hypothetical protein
MKVSDNPYVGPRAFQRRDQAIFYGRNREARELVDLIIANGAMVLYSKSGLGKTSLINAQVIPSLIEEGFEVLPVTRVSRFTPKMLDSLPIRNRYVFNALVGCSLDNDDPTSLANVTLPDYIAKLERSRDDAEDPAPFTLIFDQFEELFTTYPEHWKDRRDFFEQIGLALEQNRFLRIIFSMREEYIGELDPYASLIPDRTRARFRLEGLSKEAALVCIQEPLRGTEKKFDRGVAEELVEDLLRVHVETSIGTSVIEAQFVEPVQLQIVCYKLWESLAPTTTEITRLQLHKYGGVDRSLSSFYEEVIYRTVQATGVNQGKLRRWLESALITENGSRAVIFRGDHHTASVPNTVIDELEQQHFIKVELRGGARWYELSHDRFIQTIKDSNRKWEMQLSGTEAQVLRLERQAAAWNQHGRDMATLLKDSELEEMNAFISRGGHDIRYSDTLAAFLNASAIKNQRQRSRRRRLAFSWIAILMLLVFTLFLIVFVQRLQIEKLKRLEQQHTTR